MKTLAKERDHKNEKELYQRKLELFRAHYKNVYGVKHDDELLYIFMRMNEMQADINKNVKAISEIRFNKSWDYFMYALGSSLKSFWVLLAVLALSSAIVYYTDHKIAFHEKHYAEEYSESVKAADTLNIKKASAKNRIKKPEKRKTQ
ncbi:MAG TPA: hypothetical protein DCQ50_07920 [Chryseobacterium sp.]|nr:hypothetical protein [Chryseobacterium sp.]